MMALLDLIPKWVWAALVAALAATSCKLTVDNAGFKLEIEKGKTSIAQLRAEHLTAVAEAENAIAAAQAATRKTEQDLQLAMNDQRRKSNETLSALAADRDALRLRLQAAFAAHTTVAGITATIAGIAEAATGSDRAELSPTVRGLVDESYRAEQIRVELLGCYRAYDDARAALETPQIK
jgi:hypothetical protein